MIWQTGDSFTSICFKPYAKEEHRLYTVVLCNPIITLTGSFAALSATERSQFAERNDDRPLVIFDDDSDDDDDQGNNKRRMPAKYSHVKKRPASGQKKKATSAGSRDHTKDHQNHKRMPMHIDRGISNAMTAVSQLERAIARIFLLRFEQDIARLFSTHLYCVALIHLPTFVMRCITVGGPGWIAHNADGEDIKDFFRSVVSMELRQSGERVATKSVLWSYTALRDFVRLPLFLSFLLL